MARAAPLFDPSMVGTNCQRFPSGRFVGNELCGFFQPLEDDKPNQPTKFHFPLREFGKASVVLRNFSHNGLKGVAVVTLQGRGRPGILFHVNDNL